MTTDDLPDLSSFNVLTTPWVPLLGDAAPASLVQLWAGERDAADLDWPRDDFKVFTRLLLSALTQALFPAATIAELTERIEQPLSRAKVDARVATVMDDFYLLPKGRPGFMQSPPRAGSDGAARFVFGTPDLSLPNAMVTTVGLPAAVVALFIEQAYAGGAGRGYGAGPGGQPGVMTLIDASTVRRSMWANTIAASVRSAPKDPPTPWSNSEQPARNRGTIGLVEGLFFQARAIWLTPTAATTCSFTGDVGPTVQLLGFLPKHGLDKDKSSLWVHPNAALVQKSTGVAPVRLDPQQPTWTGLAQLMAPVSKAGRAKDPLEGPAKVLQQWRTLDLSKREVLNPRLQLLDYDRDKAILRGVFYEAFPLTDALEKSIEQLRAVTALAEDALRELTKALTSAHDDQKRGGFATADARAEFWRATEPAFLSWLAVGSTAADEDTLTAARTTMHAALRSTALRVFDAQVAMSEWDLRKLEMIAIARRRLHRRLSDLAAPKAVTAGDEAPSTRGGKTKPPSKRPAKTKEAR